MFKDLINNLFKPIVSELDLLIRYHNIYNIEHLKDSFEFHIAKIILYGNKEMNNQWINEVFSSVKIISKIKLGKEKYPEANFIKDNFFFYIMDNPIEFRNTIESMEVICRKELGEFQLVSGKKISWNNAWSAYNNFAEKCSKDISEGNFTRVKMIEYLKPLFEL